MKPNWKITVKKPVELVEESISSLHTISYVSHVLWFLVAIFLIENLTDSPTMFVWLILNLFMASHVLLTYLK